MEIKKILNPVDGSPHSERTTRYAAKLAKMVQAEMVLLHCHKKFPTILAEPHFQNAVNAIIRKSEQLVEPFARILNDSGVTYEKRILEGPAGKVIPEVAVIEKIDLIVMGSRGMTNLEGLILGSVTHRVLHAGSCAVLVVK